MRVDELHDIVTVLAHIGILLAIYWLMRIIADILLRRKHMTNWPPNPYFDKAMIRSKRASDDQRPQPLERRLRQV